jgi:hypothetical protein
MSTIIVELRSQFSEIFGHSQIAMQFDSREVSLGTIMERMFAENPGSESEMKERKLLNGRLPSAMFVSKNRILRAESLLGDGDTLMVFPHIFGG